VNERLEQEIIRLYNDDIGGAYSINEIARRLKRAYPYIHKKVTELLTQGILTEVTIGKSHLCSVNLANDDAILLLSLNESKRKRELLKREPKLKTLLQNLEGTASNIITILKAKGEVIIVSAQPVSHKVLGATVMDRESFKEFYLNDDEARRTHVVLSSFEQYHAIMRDIQGKLRMAHLFPKA
jgi:hypothetical protein